MPAQNSPQPILIFKLVGQEYALYIDDIVQIINLVHITPLPPTPDFIQGLINFRGQMVAVVDLRLRFGLLPQDYHLDTPLIIVQSQPTLLALVVDAVDDVYHVDQIYTLDQMLADDMLPDGADPASLPAESLRGVAKREQKPVLILNPRHLLSQVHLAQLETLL